MKYKKQLQLLKNANQWWRSRTIGITKNFDAAPASTLLCESHFIENEQKLTS
jgi:hypothetical protein